MNVRCLILGIHRENKKKNRESNYLIVELLDYETSFYIGIKTKMKGVSVAKSLLPVRATEKDGTPKLNVFIIRPIGIFDWAIFKIDEIIYLTDVEPSENQ